MRLLAAITSAPKALHRPTPHLHPALGALPLCVGLSCVLIFANQLPEWQFMWALAFVIYVGCKWLTWWDAGAPRTVGGLVFLLGWPGMDAAPFAARRALRVQPQEFAAALLKLALGAALFFYVAPRQVDAHPTLAAWLAMAGLILGLHCGLFHLLACVYRVLGWDVRPLMRAPLYAQSLREFWGQRWNLAFRDLTHRYLFQPFTRSLGPRAALLAGFVVSGLVHDLVISVPARGGLGLPTLYFTLQGFAILVERSALGRRLGLGRGWRGWLWTVLVVAGPVAVLFHPAFVDRVMLPFLNAATR